MSQSCLSGGMESRGRRWQREDVVERRCREFYSFRTLLPMKGCGWMTYHLTVHTIIMHMNEKTNNVVEGGYGYRYGRFIRLGHCLS